MGFFSRDKLKKSLEKGNKLFNKGKYEESLSYYDQIPEDNPNFLNALNNKGHHFLI